MGKNKKIDPDAFMMTPDPLERYPHTHYDVDLNLNWAYRCLGILRDWDMSLTHLMLKFAKLHNDDIDAIVKEIQKLINMIHSWINALTTALEAYAEAEQNGQNHIISMGQALILLTQTISAGIEEVSPILQLCLEGMQNLLKKYDQFFEDINNQISEIYVSLNGLQNQIGDIYSILDNIFEVIADLLTNTLSTKTLTYGTDYTIEFFNGFTPDSNYGGTINIVPYVTLARTVLSAQGTDYISDEIRMRTTSNYPITNSNPIIPGTPNAPWFAHQYSVTERPESRMWEITFLNELQNYTATSQLNTQGIWNMLPYSARASWDVLCALGNNGKGKLITRCVSIADGYNSQYYNSYSTNLTYGELNIDLRAYYNYTQKSS